VNLLPVQFQAYLTAVFEVRVRANMDAEVEGLVESEVKRRLEEAAGTEVIKRLQERIIETCLNLSCPRCKKVWNAGPDFNECFSLKCGNPTCFCDFCGYCGVGFDRRGSTDFGVDECHTHIYMRQCSPYNVGLFPEDMSASFIYLRSRKIKAFLSTVDKSIRDEVIIGVVRELLDVELQPANFLSALYGGCYNHEIDTMYISDSDSDLEEPDT